MLSYIGNNGQSQGAFYKVDDFSSQFNGSTKTFDIKVGGNTIKPGTAMNLVVGVGGKLLNPEVDYTVSGYNITFTNAPSSGTKCGITILGHVFKEPTSGNTDLNSLSDVVIGSPQNDQVLMYSGGSWVNRAQGTQFISSSEDVDTSGASNGDVLTFDGAKWKPNTPADSFTANISSVSEGDIIVYRSGEWVNENPTENDSTTISTIDDIGDVNTTTITPTNGQALVWNETDNKWIPGDVQVSGGSVTIDSINDLGDVNTSIIAPSEGQVLAWSNENNEWRPKTIEVSGGGTVINSLNDVNDVSVSSATDGQALVWVSGEGKWKPQTISMVGNISDLSDVASTSPSSGQALVWNGNKWIPGDVSSVTINSISDIADVDTDGATNGQSLVFDGSKWKPATVESGGGGTSFDITTHSIKELADVTNNNATSGQALVWNGSKWSPGDVSSVAINSINDISDVSTSDAVSGQALIFDGSQWKPQNVSSGGESFDITTHSIKELSDVNDETEPTDGQVMVWNGGKWKPTTIGMSGGGGSFNIGEHAIGELSDIDTSGASSGQSLVYDGSKWKPGTIESSGGGSFDIGTHNIEEFANVDGTGAENGKALIYDGTKWKPQNVGSVQISQHTLKELKDVPTSNPSVGQTLVWNGSSWRYSLPPNSPMKSTELTDVAEEVCNKEGGILRWNNQQRKWTPKPFPEFAITDMTDVDDSVTPSSGQILSWNDEKNKLEYTNLADLSLLLKRKIYCDDGANLNGTGTENDMFQSFSKSLKEAEECQEPIIELNVQDNKNIYITEGHHHIKLYNKYVHIRNKVHQNNITSTIAHNSRHNITSLTIEGGIIIFDHLQFIDAIGQNVLNHNKIKFKNCERIIFTGCRLRDSKHYNFGGFSFEGCGDIIFISLDSITNLIKDEHFLDFYNCNSVQFINPTIKKTYKITPDEYRNFIRLDTIDRVIFERGLTSFIYFNNRYIAIECYNCPNIIIKKSFNTQQSSIGFKLVNSKATVINTKNTFSSSRDFIPFDLDNSNLLLTAQDTGMFFWEFDQNKNNKGIIAKNNSHVTIEKIGRSHSYIPAISIGDAMNHSSIVILDPEFNPDKFLPPLTCPLSTGNTITYGNNLSYVYFPNTN